MSAILLAAVLLMTAIPRVSVAADDVCYDEIMHRIEAAANLLSDNRFRTHGVPDEIRNPLLNAYNNAQAVYQLGIDNTQERIDTLAAALADVIAAFIDERDEALEASRLRTDRLRDEISAATELYVKLSEYVPPSCSPVVYALGRATNAASYVARLPFATQEEVDEQSEALAEAVANVRAIFGGFRFGDVDGDGKLTHNDAIQIYRYLVNLPSIIDTCPRAQLAANVRQRVSGGQMVKPEVQDAVQIGRRIVGLNSVLDDVWNDEDVTRVWVPIPLELRGEICIYMGAVFYYNTTPIPAEAVYCFSYGVVPGMMFGNERNNTFGFGISNAIFHNGYAAETQIAFNWIVDLAITPADFTLDPDHDENAIVWVFCECEGCAPPQYAEVADAIAILRAIVGLSSDATTETHNFTKSGTLEVRDAILVLRSVAGLEPPVRL
jgi:hypothetical protein